MQRQIGYQCDSPLSSVCGASAAAEHEKCRSVGRLASLVVAFLAAHLPPLSSSVCGTDLHQGLNGYCIHCGQNSYMNPAQTTNRLSGKNMPSRLANSAHRLFEVPLLSSKSTQRTNAALPMRATAAAAVLFFVHPPELICRFSQPITFSTAPQEEREEERGKDLFLSLSPCERCGVYVHTYFPSGKGGREEAS